MARLTLSYAGVDASAADRVSRWAADRGYDVDRLSDGASSAEAAALVAGTDALVTIVSPAWLVSAPGRAALHEATVRRRPVFMAMVSGSGELVLAFAAPRLALSDTEAAGFSRLAIEVDASVSAALATRSAYRFCAFISYSHRDKRHARWLHRAIESYRVPGPLIGRTTAAGRVGHRVGQAFRDDEELKGAADLGALLQGALEESETLVVICSPDAARSPYVNEEIASFKRLGREGRIIPVIVAGTPHDPQRECFPPALTRKVGPDGLLTDVPAEPIAVDHREHGARRTVLKVIAGITGVEFDELERRDRRRRARQRRAIGGSVAVAAALLLTATVVVDRNVGRQALMDRAAKLLPERRPLVAAQLALANLPRDTDLWPAGGEAAATLMASGYAFPTRTLAPEALYADAELTSDGSRLITRTQTGLVQIWDVAAGRPVADLDFVHYGAPTTFEFTSLSSDEQRLITSNPQGPAELWDARDGHWVAELGAGNRTSATFSGDGKWILGAFDDEDAALYEANDGASVATFGPASATALSADASRLLTQLRGERRVVLWDGRTGRRIAEYAGTLFDVKLSPDGKRSTVREAGGATLWDATTGRLIARLGGEHDAYRVEMSPDGTRVATIATDSAVVLWDTADGRRLGSIGEQGSGGVWFSAAGDLVATLGSSRKVRLYDARTAAPLREIGEPDEGAGGVYFVPGRPRVVLLTKNIALTLRDSHSGAMVARLTDDNEAYGLKISNDGRIIQAKDANHWVKLWDADTGSSLGALSGPREGHSWMLDRRNTHAFTISIDGSLRLKRLYADLHPAPAALRARVCQDNREAIGTFPADERRAATPSGRALRGRPWQPCDWQGLRSFEGWLQLMRYWGTRAGLQWDYDAHETSAAGQWRRAKHATAS